MSLLSKIKKGIKSNLIKIFLLFIIITICLNSWKILMDYSIDKQSAIVAVASNRARNIEYKNFMDKNGNFNGSIPTVEVREITFSPLVEKMPNEYIVRFVPCKKVLHKISFFLIFPIYDSTRLHDIVVKLDLNGNQI